MKSLKLAVVAISLIGIFGVGNAMAADTATITVTAAVVESCSFNTTTATLNFGDLDTLVGGEVTPAVPASIKYICTAGTTYTIENDVTDLLKNGTSSIIYSLDYTPVDGGTSNGTEQTLSVSGKILDGAYDTATAGAYTADAYLSFLY
ncbi:MAG: spore coat protein U domain-containing protein [Desulfuromonadales bacterium]|nr:spore coat protein U domain-containing protein [Desulfuromonadales bacterium]